MDTGLTDTQETLLDRVARTSKKVFLRKMIRDANRSDNDREIRRIEKLIQDLHGDVREVKDTTGWLSKFVGTVFKFGGNEAEKKYPSRSKR